MKIKVNQKPVNIKAFLDKVAVSQYLRETVNEAKKTFIENSIASAGGRSYRRAGRVHIASKEGDFPARDTGTLIQGTETKYASMSVTLGTNISYAIYLNDGTYKMGARKMYKDALDIAVFYSKSNHNFIKYGGK